ncbi:MAG: hypothetical protein GXP14_01620 [Gammaproteobacteria bacterium]|nr:hypothetical protein [Gammaproteobacteria bacterium]
MGWKFDKPLHEMASEEESTAMLRQWESEKHGGLWEGNNRLPLPFTYLIALIVLTAFMITMPIWGQRPNAEHYAPMVNEMDSAAVQNLATDEEKMKYLTAFAMKELATASDPRGPGLLERHPITWDDLQNIAPGIREAQTSQKYPLAFYNIVGDKIALANFEGNRTVNGDFFGEPTNAPARVQPWFDKGMIIDLFYVSYFFIVLILITKRLPSFTRKPDMSKTS